MYLMYLVGPLQHVTAQHGPVSPTSCVDLDPENP
ncbi:hypothetical protein GMORB2_5692 [Geosmithia morbida]|uniref:Uncharacterized protein n=1 Tax=Geosmithia morbida TaxID=1094350 RepID=A0A9P5D4X0_9HYPO|nr:uncharacterized protein GMORB2_5692 [Geosmithia morbida]KAF4123976.1 hypothetical protein GMORB2_5692 [Geosmithia morbida]